MLFSGKDASGNVGLWLTNGTAAGTTEIGGTGNAGISGVSTNGNFDPGFLATILIPPPDDFTGNNTSNVLFNYSSRRDTGYWLINGSGSVGQWVDLGAGGASYSAVGTGDFLRNGLSDVLWFNSTTGDTGFWSISNGTVSGWHDLGAAGAGYSVVGIGDYLANNTSDVLFANASGDTGYWIISNGTVIHWHDLGNSGAGYSVLSPPGDSMDTPSLRPGGGSSMSTLSDPVSARKV